MLTEFLPEKDPPPRHIWDRIDREVSGSRISFSRPLFWPLTVIALGIVALVLVAVV